MSIDTDADVFIKAPGGRHVPVEVHPDGEIVLPKEFSVNRRTPKTAHVRRGAGQVSADGGANGSVVGAAHGSASGAANGAVQRVTKTVRLKTAPAAELYKVDQALTRVVDVLGNNATAALLGVASSQPSRWKSGKERLSRASASAVVQLDAFLATMLSVFTPEQAELWLSGSEPHLGGARPADVFRLRGLAGVLPALQAIEEGAYA
ncbi:MAG TPA: hypothetical protein VGX23_31435 [Actinocrinis sp.]|nr:hypothetical protein [Actinocrinis sp.]